jgi:putrescine transport system ATP-binding protein
MSSRIAVMNAGYIAQLGTPGEIYEYPQSKFVASFIGSVNLFEGRVAEDHPDHVLVDCPEAGCRLEISHALPVLPGTPVSVAVRPEKIALSREPVAGDINVTHGVVREIAYLGNHSIYLIALASGKTVRVTAPNVHRMAEPEITWEDEVWLSWRPAAGVVLTQ